MPTIFQIIFYWFTYAVLKFFAHFEVEGQENLKEVENRSVIFASNHASYIDGGICCGIAMPRSSLWPKKFLPMRFLTVDRFFTWRYFPINIFLKMGGTVKVQRAKVKYPDGRHL